MSDSPEEILGRISEQLNKIDDKIKVVETHPSQNGGWKTLMTSIERIEGQVTAIDISLNDPNTGAIAKINDQIAWRGRVDPVLDDNRKQDERLLKLEMQVHLYNKVTWAIGVGVLGLIVKAFAGLIMTP